MLASEQLQRALGLAYRYLERRERTVSEVRRHLEQRGVEPSVAVEATAILGEDGYLDDERYVRLFAQDKRTLEQWGGDRIRRTLLGRGVDRDLIEAVLGEEDDAGDGGELARAVALLRARFAVPPRERRERDRALGILLRKGYDSEIAVEALANFSLDPSDS